MAYTEHILETTIDGLAYNATMALDIPFAFNTSSYPNAMFEVEHLAICLCPTGGCGAPHPAQSTKTYFQYTTSSSAIVLQADTQVWQPYSCSALLIGYQSYTGPVFRITAQNVISAMAPITSVTMLAHVKVTY